MLCFFCYVFTDVRACMCAWTAVSPVAHTGTQPYCSSSFTMFMCITVKCYLMNK